MGRGKGHSRSNTYKQNVFFMNSEKQTLQESLKKYVECHLKRSCMEIAIMFVETEKLK